MKIFLNTVLLVFLPVLIHCAGQNAGKEAPPWSTRIADAFIQRHPGAVTYDSASPNTRWNYEQGLMLIALCRKWQQSGEEKYFDFVRKNLEQYVGADGTIKTYKRSDFNLDNILPGRSLLLLYESTHDQKFRLAADTLRSQLKDQPRTREGGFWHKKIYPNQMWLDGLYMAEPFYTDYALMIGDQPAFDDIANQFLFVTRHTRNPKTGLLYHGWDESKEQAWSDKETGCSPSFWGRSMGWYAMGLVDVLEDFPKNSPRRKELAETLQQFAAAIVRYRDEKTHLWYQVVDRANAPGNYLESSASSMFVYALAKGVRLGLLEKKYLSIAKDAFEKIVQHFCVAGEDGFVDFLGTCGAAGLGGTPYRDGSYEYYTGIAVQTNDKRGVGAFLCAALELERDSLVTMTGKKQ